MCSLAGTASAQQPPADAGAANVTAPPEPTPPEVLAPDPGREVSATPPDDVGTREPGVEDPPAAAPLAPGATAPEAVEEPWTLRPPTVTGFIQVHFRTAFRTGEDPLVDNPNFRVQRARLGVEGELFPWLGYTLGIDPRAPEILGVLRDAYFTLRFIPRHRIRIGQQKTQFGYENRESSTRLFAVNRTELADNLARGSNLRDVGIGLLGNIKLGHGFRIEDAVTLVNGNGFNTQLDDTPLKDLWGRIGLRYKRGSFWARLGFSGGIGDRIELGDDNLPGTADDFHLSFRRVGADLEIDQKWFFLSSEFIYGWDHPGDMEIESRYGWYLNVVGKTPWDIGPIVRYDMISDDEFQRFTFGLYYGKADAPFRVMVNYELRLVREGARVDDKLYLWAQVRFGT